MCLLDIPLACISFFNEKCLIFKHNKSWKTTFQKYTWTIPWHGSGYVTSRFVIPIKFKLFITIKIVKGSWKSSELHNSNLMNIVYSKID